jgi:hypothetical protein
MIGNVQSNAVPSESSGNRKLSPGASAPEACEQMACRTSEFGVRKRRTWEASVPVPVVVVGRTTGMIDVWVGGIELP